MENVWLRVRCSWWYRLGMADGGNAGTRGQREGDETSQAQKRSAPIFPKYTIVVYVFRTPSNFLGIERFVEGLLE